MTAFFFNFSLIPRTIQMKVFCVLIKSRVHIPEHWPFKCLSLEGEFKSNKNHMPMSLILFLFPTLKRVLLSLLDNPTTTVPKPSWKLVKFRASTNMDTTEFLWELQHHLENICSINIHNLFTWQNIYQKEIKDKCRKDQEDEIQKLSVFYSKLTSCNSKALILLESQILF